MRKTFITVVLLSFLIVSMALTGTAQAEGKIYGYVAADTPVYEDAEGTVALESQIPADTWVTLVSEGEKSHEISMSDGAKGFVRIDAISIADAKLSSSGEVTNEGHFVNLREKESLHAKVLEKVDDGTLLTIEGHEKGWYAVSVNGVSGYMVDRMVTAGPAAVSFKYIHSNNGKAVNLRSAPEAKDDNIITRLKEGTELDVLIAGNQWDWVRANGKLGFILTAFTSDRNENEKIPQTFHFGYVVLDNPTSLLHVRESADLNSRMLHAYHIGTKMQILGDDGQFAEVQVGKVHGYVQSKYLNAHKKSYSNADQHNTYNSDGFMIATLINPNGSSVVNFRDQPSAKSNILSQQPVGVEAEVYSKGAGYCKVRLGGEWGYINSNFLYFK